MYVVLRGLNLPASSALFLLCLLFEPEYGGSTILRHVGLSPNYTALQPENPCFSNYSSTILYGSYRIIIQCVEQLITGISAC
jgi:hypothetical protein